MYAAGTELLAWLDGIVSKVSNINEYISFGSIFFEMKDDLTNKHRVTMGI